MSNGFWKFLTIILLIVVIVLGWWQYRTYQYLNNDLREWLEDHGGGDGTQVPRPPPPFGA